MTRVHVDDVESDPGTKRHAGGRPHGVKSHHNDCLFKRCPCARRRWSDCPHAWHYAIGYAGRGYRGTLNKYFGLPRFYPMSRSDAEALLDKLRVEIREGRYQPRGDTSRRPDTVVSNTPLTFEDVAKVFTKEFKADPNRRAHRGRALEMQLDVICRTLIPAAHGTFVRFGDKPIAEFRTPDIEAFRDRRRQEMRENELERIARATKRGNSKTGQKLPPVSPELPHRRAGEIGINRHFEVIRRVFNWATLKGHYERESPFLLHGKRAIRFASQKARTRRLQSGEEQRLLDAAAPHLQALVMAALETGCRKGELLSLQWRDVLCNDKNEPRTLSLRAENTKTDTARTVPVSPRLRAVLEMRRVGLDGKQRGPEEFVFGNEVGEQVGEFKLAWRGACQRAGISGLTFHDLRREHGSRLVEGGVNLLTVSRLLGHRRVSTTDTYLKASEDIAEQELQKYHERREAIAEAKPS